MKFLRKIPFIVLSFFVIITAFIGCSVDSNSNQGHGRLVVQLTDAPATYDAVYIDIQSVRVHTDADIDADTIDSDSEAASKGWVTINTKPVRVNLLDLRNGDTIQLGDEEVEAGTYHQIRFILGPDNEIVINGQSFPLKTPSAQQSGLKLNLDATVEDGETYNLLVDFDAGRSIVATGSGKFLLKPVLHAVSLEETGTLKGTVAPADFQTSVMAIAGSDTLSTLTDDSGRFKIIGVTKGTYNVVFKPNSSAYKDTTLTNVAVDVSEDVDLGSINLSAQ